MNSNTTVTETHVNTEQQKENFSKLVVEFKKNNFPSFKMLVNSYRTNLETVENIDKEAIEMFDYELSTENKKSLQTTLDNYVDELKASEYYKGSGAKGEKIVANMNMIFTLSQLNLKLIQKGSSDSGYTIADYGLYKEQDKKIQTSLSELEEYISN